MKKIIAFDCDSTLSSIEGIDELAKLTTPSIFQKVEKLTNLAMNGEIPVQEAFSQRLKLISPSLSECQQIGQLYLTHIEPTAKETILQLQEKGWHTIIISGGFSPCIQPLAEHLNISEVHAVPLHFQTNGSYQSFDTDYPTTRDGGKPQIIENLKAKYHSKQFIMVGDGNSDLETTPHVTQFIAFTGFVSRPTVRQHATHQVSIISELIPILESSKHLH